MTDKSATDHQAINMDRAIRIERLRLQAAIDRDQLSHAAMNLVQSCRPSNMLGQWLSGLSFAQPNRLLSKGVNWLSDYPYIAASLSSLFLSRRSRILRLAGLVLGSIGAWRAVLRAAARDQSTR